VLALPGVHLHDYGKAPRPGRKLGHCTAVATTPERRDRVARRLLALADPGTPAALRHRDLT
jgi:5-(carboxyamino)imidazole ribonucleotide synthase